MSKYHFLAVAAVLAGTALALPADDQYEFVNGQWVKSVPPAKGTPAGELAMIRNLIREGRNVAAVSAADKFLKAYPDSPLREEAMMLAGQAEINRDRYFQAYEWYKRQWEEYPNGQYAERTLQREFQIAEAFLKGKKRIVAYILYLPARQDGLDILNRIVEQAPGSTLAEMSLLRIAEDHFGHAEYTEAAAAYDRHIELFSKSPKVREASLQAALATHLSWRGVEFDPTPLIEAQQRYRNFNEQYPQTAGKANVPTTLRRIETQRAGEEFNTAKFYERTGHRQAAAYYYRRVENQYPNTDYALRAQAAIKALGPLAAPVPPPPSLIASKRPIPGPASRVTSTAVATGPGVRPPLPTQISPPPRKPSESEPTDIEKILPAEED